MNQAVAQPKAISLTFALLFACSSLFAQSHPFISFDAAGAGSVTTPSKINAAGQIAGYYLTAAYHGFVRSPDGSITTFNPPSARNTYARGINDSGQIVGYSESAGPYHGFLRSPSNRFTEVMYPGSGQTWAISINNNGVIAGYYADSSNFHGFIRDASGNFTAIDAPGAGTGNGEGTHALAIDNNGEVTGNVVNSSGTHGFFRDATGITTTFDVPGTGTYPMAFNSGGEVTGEYIDTGARGFAFIRHTDGSFTTFSALGTRNTVGSSINDNGYVCGVGYSRGGSDTGFLRDPAGNFTQYSGPQPNSSGFCTDVNNNLRATGTYSDSSGTWHAWVK